jgi:predicted amidohydrolase YtcJ
MIAMDHADLIITNARVWTVDARLPAAEAVAVAGDRIVAVGSVADIDLWRGSATRVIDGRGRRLLPGFNDAHLHLMIGGAELDRVRLRDASTPQELAQRIGSRAAARPGEWILGGEWDEQAWPGGILPTRDLIDPMTGDIPVFVSRYDLHMALANGAALRRAGVTRDTPDPPGGAVVRDVHGEPTGILKDSAMEYVKRVVPRPSDAERACSLGRALERLARFGVTSVQDMNPGYEDVDVYASLARRGALTARIFAAPLVAEWAVGAAAGSAPGHDDPFLRVAGVKGFADGSLGSTTAFFFEPYLDAPGTRGLLSDEMQVLERTLASWIDADRAGQQLRIHGIGDRAISIVLDLFEQVAAANGPRDRRLRIEHAQHVAAKDFDRFSRLGVIASVQPYHVIDDGRWAERRIGAERAKTTFPFRTFLDRRIPLAFGTDWPVAPLDPMLGLHAATTRATLDGRRPGGWVPEQRISMEEAIEAYTLGAAHAEFEEREKGSITPGKLADLVILDGDPLTLAPDAICDVRVEMTIVGGKVIYET